MPFIETKDKVNLYYRDWGTGSPVVFISSWSLSSEMWEYQMVPLSEQGLRCIAYDRRGHGRSDDPGRGYDFDTLADDLAALLDQLDLRAVTLVCHSMGSGEVARYIARHGSKRIAKTVFISPITPFLLKTEDNPAGVPQQFLDRHLDLLKKDRPRYFKHEGAIKFFGIGAQWPLPSPISAEMVDWFLDIIMQPSPKAVLDTRRAANETDFRPDLATFDIPTLVIHGDRDQNSPLELCGRRTAQAIKGSQLVIYEGAAHGLFITEQERLTQDLLTFIRS